MRDRARNGSSVMLRKVTPWRAAGSGFESNAADRGRELRADARRARLSASRATSTAGNCHMREKSTSSCAPGSRTSRVRPRGSRRIAAAMRMFTGARFLRGAGISCSETSSVGAAPARYRAIAAARRLRRANDFAEFHQRLVPIAGRFAREQASARCRASCCQRARFAQIAANRAEAREDARDVAVEHGERHVIGNAQHRGGGVSADAGQRERLFERSREIFRVARDDFCAARVQIPRAAVVAEAGPQFQDFCSRRACASDSTLGSLRGNDGSREHGGDARLLQHDFRDPDAIGIAAGAPGKIAAMRAEPAEQARWKFCVRAESGFHSATALRAIRGQKISPFVVRAQRLAREAKRRPACDAGQFEQWLGRRE